MKEFECFQSFIYSDLCCLQLPAALRLCHRVDLLLKPVCSRFPRDDADLGRAEDELIKRGLHNVSVAARPELYGNVRNLTDAFVVCESEYAETCAAVCKWMSVKDGKAIFAIVRKPAELQKVLCSLERDLVVFTAREKSLADFSLIGLCARLESLFADAVAIITRFPKKYRLLDHMVQENQFLFCVVAFRDPFFEDTPRISLPPLSQTPEEHAKAIQLQLFCPFCQSTNLSGPTIGTNTLVDRRICLTCHKKSNYSKETKQVMSR